jgi:hypothetical protein
MNNFKADVRDDVFILFAHLSGMVYPIFYDADKEVMRDVTHAVQDFYGDGIPSKDESNKRDFCYHIRRFLIYLYKDKLSIDRLSDSHLKMYRNTILLELQNKKDKQIECIKSKRTVNLYLRNIYKFIANYALRTNNPYLIGCTEQHQIQSGQFNEQGLRVDKNKEIKFYPLEFKVPSSSSGASLSKSQMITQSDFIELKKVIDESKSELFTKERDKLILDVARGVKFRRGSIISLTATMFKDISEAEETGEMTITPPIQKFGYELSFDISYSLALEIKVFIDTVLKPYLVENKLRTHWDGHIFVTNKAKGITGSYVSHRINIYAEKLGWPDGKRLHAVRHLASIDTIETEFTRQLELHPNDPEMARKIATITLKDKLGHLSEESQRTYIAHSSVNKVDELKRKKHECEKIEVAERAREQAELIKLKMKAKRLSEIDIDFN